MLLDDIGDYLASCGVGVVGTTIFLGGLPATPDRCIALRQSGGSPPIESFDGILVEQPAVQMLTRGVDYRDTRRFIEKAYQSFLSLHNQLINTTWYLSTEPITPPVWLEHDDTQRHIFVCNVAVERKW